jgi:hypothetical protein
VAFFVASFFLVVFFFAVITIPSAALHGVLLRGSTKQMAKKQGNLTVCTAAKKPCQEKKYHFGIFIALLHLNA